MEGYIDICGKPIEIKSIKDFKVIDVEYIFRPVYREESVKKLLSKSKKYVFESMEPYAAIKSGKRQVVLCQDLVQIKMGDFSS